MNLKKEGKKCIGSLDKFLVTNITVTKLSNFIDRDSIYNMHFQVFCQKLPMFGCEQAQVALVERI